MPSSEEGKAKKQEYHRAYYQANKDKILAEQHRYYEQKKAGELQRTKRRKQSREEIAAKRREYFQKWYEENREALNQRRKVKTATQPPALISKQTVQRKLLRQAKTLLTLREASEWLDQPEQRQEFGIKQGPKPDTLKKMTQANPPRLLTVKKGAVLLTNEPALRLMMATYVETGGRKAGKVQRLAKKEKKI